MKKTIIALICVVTICATILCGCSLFESVGGSKSKPVPKIELTIHDGSSTRTVEVTPGMKTAITPHTKKDHYLKGYFDQEQNGTKYIDSAGVSLIEWKSTNPTELYAQWGNIYDLLFEESPDYIMEFGLSMGHDVVGVELGLEIVNAIIGNPEALVEVTAKFKAKGAFKGYQANIWISDKSSTSGEQIARLDQGLSTSYTEYTISDIVESRIFKNGKMYLYVEHGDFFGMGYAKDITLTFKFVEEPSLTPYEDSSALI